MADTPTSPADATGGGESHTPTTGYVTHCVEAPLLAAQKHIAQLEREVERQANLLSRQADELVLQRVRVAHLIATRRPR